MKRGVRCYLISSVVLVALVALAGCSHYFLAEREPWRRDAELACLNSGAVKETPQRVRISAINGPGMCGADYPLKISALGESTPLGYDDEPVRPPSGIPAGQMPQRWPIVQSTPLPPPPAGPSPYGSPQYGASQNNSQQYGAQQYGSRQYGAAQAGPPMTLTPPGLPEAADDDYEDVPPGVPRGPDNAPRPYYGPPPSPAAQSSVPTYSPRPQQPAYGETVPLGPAREPAVTGSTGMVEVKPAATLACPIVSELDRWISAAVQPAALRWFQQPVVEIKQISSYSCRGMNGNPNAHISEHAFGNALDIAEFLLADGHKVSVQYGWHGTPEEQGFLHDVQAAACQEFTTVLAPGANVYHYNHIHVDLMRHAGGRHICEPKAIPGDVVAERARGHYAAQHGDVRVTGSITEHHRAPLSYSGEDDDRLPLAVPGDD